MKMQSYKEVLDEVMPIYHQDPDRFMRFYHAVNNILATIPEGESIRIDEHCTPASRDLFIKIATMYIMEEMILKSSDDYNAIRHVPRIVLSTPRPHFYSNRR